MKLRFEAYDALDQLQPIQDWDVQSSFRCDKHPYVLGVWVIDPSPNLDFPNMTQVIPLYLTQEQLEVVVNLEDIKET